MNEYRVTKYNPAFRDQSGAYTKVEWISFTQNRANILGVPLTSDEYEHVANSSQRLELEENFSRTASFSTD